MRNLHFLSITLLAYQFTFLLITLVGNVFRREISQMERFRLQQKIMEEQNKQKRALLAQAITARRQRAKSEANRLTQVQEQLNALDQMLTTDISIIRNRIEEASVEYLDAQ